MNSSIGNREVSEQFRKIVATWSVAQCQDYLQQVSNSINKCSVNHMLPIWQAGYQYVNEHLEQLRHNTQNKSFT